MRTITLKSEQLNLPPEIARRLKGKDVELLEVEEGFLLKPLGACCVKGFPKAGSRATLALTDGFVQQAQHSTYRRGLCNRL